MNVSKGLHVGIKRMDVFHTLMDKPTSKGVNPIVHGLKYVRFIGEGVKTTPSLQFEPKVVETLNFVRSIPFKLGFQKYLNTMLCQQIFCCRQRFLVKISQNFIKVRPFSNCYTGQQVKVKATLNPH